ncbi:MAG: DUF1365 domain-containing protein [Marinobacter sp.]|nr:DUF1365 domain-containing protein [Marinobacter sp.]
MGPDRLANSHWLTGEVRHRRMSPVGHQFSYHTGMLALELDDWFQLPEISRWVSLESFNWMSLKRADYLAPETPCLKEAVRDQAERATGWRPDGAIQLITHPRYLGYVFNPVSFYFCYAHGHSPADGALPKVILAQITNTPWKERHVYCMDDAVPFTSAQGWQSLRFAFSKRFHVSPFNPMDQQYQWLFSFKGPEIRIHMNVRDQESKVFDATLMVQRTPLERTTLHQSLRQFPLESFKVIGGIYWHALKLKLKGAVFYTHPDKLEPLVAAANGRDDQGLRVDMSQPTSGRVSSWRT